MTVQLNHTIVWCRDKRKSAAFLTEMLGLPKPTQFGPFLVVELGNNVSLDFHDTAGSGRRGEDVSQLANAGRVDAGDT